MYFHTLCYLIQMKLPSKNFSFLYRQLFLQQIPYYFTQCQIFTKYLPYYNLFQPHSYTHLRQYRHYTTSIPLCPHALIPPRISPHSHPLFYSLSLALYIYFVFNLRPQRLISLQSTPKKHTAHIYIRVARPRAAVRATLENLACARALAASTYTRARKERERESIQQEVKVNARSGV